MQSINEQNANGSDAECFAMQKCSENASHALQTLSVNMQTLQTFSQLLRQSTYLHYSHI